MSSDESTLPIDWLMTTEEICAYLRIPRDTLYKWRGRGEGPPGLRVGKYVRWRRDDVEEWLETRRDAA